MSRTKILDPRRSPVQFHGQLSLDVNAAGVMPWRLPCDKLDLFHPVLVERAACGAGVRLDMISDTATIAVDFELSYEKAEDCFSFDLLVDGKLHDQQMLPSDAASVRFSDLPRGSHRLEVWLPQGNPVRIKAVHIDADATAEPFDDDRSRWLTYGSSITQAKRAASPSTTWPALVASRFNLHLICMGYGGQCHLETTVGRAIRDTRVDFISMCLGINVYDSSLSPRTFREQVIGLVQLIREKQPETPIVCISPIYSPPRESTPSASGNTLEAMREQVADAVERLRAHGDRHLHCVSGLDVCGPGQLEHMPDQLHPNDRGQYAVADGIAKHVMPRFGLA